MADYLELYFGSPDNIDTTVEALGEFLGVRFELSRMHYADYEAHDGRRHYDLALDNDEEEDDPADDMPFTKMPYVLTLRGDRDMDAELEEIGRELIRQVQQRGYVPARLVYATTNVLAKAN
ncbi:hypothetical protein NLX83_23870 [Allokutzneria sp. A3M-2-11 16]|uniref:hypothetical protein n=1 Tax=Allokutzneria sp. A3M-2-11 16 TaxID=2962043 RepID=UPI0020B8F527|nr:hypothetical protein [Allokutzneria sp. A3M-2-11 16]MCP3802313.1 hypothetical protein [Allokutzneria sp. A3M-2-11 16]